MNIVFIIIYFLWFLSEVLINRLFPLKEKDLQHADKGSLYLIWTIIFISNFTAIYVSNTYKLPIARDPVIEYFGLALILGGIILRIAIIRSLGRFFTVNVTIREDHQLKKDGFFKYIRHPSYAASLVSFIGFGISLNNILSLVILFLLVLTAFIIRIRVEEKALIKHFGSTYLDYQEATKRILPFIY